MYSDKPSLCLINKTRLLWAARWHKPSIWDDFEQLYADVVEHCHQGWLQFGDFQANDSGGNSERLKCMPLSDRAVYLHNVCLVVRWSRIGCSMFKSGNRNKAAKYVMNRICETKHKSQIKVHLPPAFYRW